MNKNFKILDCTLRDGGYYNNWDFDNEIVNHYCDFIESSPIDFVEVGYRSIPLEGYLGKYFYCPIYVLEHLKKRMPSKELVVILNEKDIKAVHVDELLKPCIGLVSMIRIAINPINILSAVELAKKVKSLGFKVAFNVMYMSDWKKDSSFLKHIRGIEGFVDYFYMVDSFGGVMINDIKETIDLVRENSKNIAIGFHGHNNLQMATANTIEAINQGCTIVDGTITGMGRGAGNLRTELFLTYLESEGLFKINYNLLSKVVFEFEKLKEYYKWGTNLPYMFSGANSLPQKQVMEWVGLNRYPISSILTALKNQKDFIEDNVKLDVLSLEQKFEKVLIIGGGESVIYHRNAILKMLENNSDICLIHAGARYIDKFLGVNNKQYYSLVGSENKKLSDRIEDYSQLKGTCVYPPYPRKMGTEIPQELVAKSQELETISFTNVSNDSPLAIAIQTSINIGVNTIYFIGFDGYKEEINSIQQLMTQENQNILDDLRSIKSIKSEFLTPTKYKKVNMNSIYKYL